MRQSRVLQKLRAGNVANCFNVHFDAQVTDIAGMAGYDCVWIDFEHMAQDWSSLQMHIWAAKGNNMDVIGVGAHIRQLINGISKKTKV